MHQSYTCAKLPSALFSAYKQYKQDTARLASWLGDTATSLGYDFALAAKSSPVPPKKSPKGKAKAEHNCGEQPSLPKAFTRDAQATPPPRVIDAESDVPITVMSTAQFVELAQFIAAAEPPVTVPTRVIDWACRAVMARRSCAEWFRSPSPVQDDTNEVEKSNEKHQYFISILEQVVDILAARVGSSFKSQLRPSATTGVELLASRFAALAMEEKQEKSHRDGLGAESDSEDDLSDWDAVDAAVKETLSGNPTADIGHRRKYRVKCAEDIEHEFFERFMDFMDTLEELRSFVSETWGMYMDGSVSLECASLSTLAVLDHMRAEYEACAAEYPDLIVDHAKYARIALRHYCAQQNVPDSVNEDGDYFNTDVWNYAKFLLLPQLEAILPLKDQIYGGNKELVNPPVLRETDQNRFLTAWRQVLVLVYNTMGYTESLAPKTNCDCVNAYNRATGHAFDALRTFRTLAPGQPVPLLTLVTIDINMTLFSELVSHPAGNYSDRIKDDFNSVNQLYIASLNRFSARMPSRSSALCFKGTSKYLESLCTSHGLWISDTETFPDDAEPLGALRNFTHTVNGLCPLYTGLTLMNTRIHMQAFAMPLVDSWQAVLYGAYVHEALRLTSEEAGDQQWTNRSWPLMDDFIALYGVEGIFFGREPDSLRSLWTSMNLAFGTLSFKDLKAWQESTRRGTPVPKMRFQGIMDAPKPRKNERKDERKNRKGNRSAGVCGLLTADNGRNHRRQAGKCDDQIKKVVTVEKLLLADGPVGASGIAISLRSPSVFVGRFARGLPRPDAARAALTEAAVVNGFYSKRQRRKMPPAALFLQLRHQIANDLMPLYEHDLLRLHVQAVQVLQLLRKEIVENGRLAVLISRCANCRLRDDFLPISVWNLIRALGAEEGTGQPLGPVRTAQETKEALAILNQVKALVATFDHFEGEAETIQFKHTMHL